MKTAIIYYSKHHGNTKQLAEAIQNASSDEITLINVTETPNVNLDEYDLIGYASGIYYSKFHKQILQFAKNNTPRGKNIFLLYTYGVEKPGYTKAIREALSGTNATILGEYGCLGLNTFGPFKLIGGIAKNHPNDADIQHAISFYQSLHP